MTKNRGPYHLRHLRLRSTTTSRKRKITAVRNAFLAASEHPPKKGWCRCKPVEFDTRLVLSNGDILKMYPARKEARIWTAEGKLKEEFEICLQCQRRVKSE